MTDMYINQSSLETYIIPENSLNSYFEKQNCNYFDVNCRVTCITHQEYNVLKLFYNCVLVKTSAFPSF